MIFYWFSAPIDADFKTMAISDEMEVAKIASQMTILDFRDSVVVVAAQSKNFLICDN